jgi:hypothetical protein
MSSMNDFEKLNKMEIEKWKLIHFTSVMICSYRFDHEIDEELKDWHFIVPALVTNRFPDIT